MSYRGARLRCVATWPNCRSRSTSNVRAPACGPDAAPPPARSTAVFTARVVVPTPPFGEKKAVISPAAAPRSARGRRRPKRMRSASTRPSSSRAVNSVLITSSAPASRNAMRASTSPAGAITSTGVGLASEAVWREPIAPETERPSATTRSIGPSPRAATAAGAVATVVIR